MLKKKALIYLLAQTKTLKTLCHQSIRYANMPWRRMSCRSSKLDALSFTSPAACRSNCWQRKNMKNKVLLKPEFHPIEKCFSGMVFIVFCSCGMKDPKGFMTARQTKGQAWLETLGYLDGMNALKELIPQECFLCFCQKKQFFDSGSKIATSFCAIRYMVPPKKHVVKNITE